MVKTGGKNRKSKERKAAHTRAYAMWKVLCILPTYLVRPAVDHWSAEPPTMTSREAFLESLSLRADSMSSPKRVSM